MNENVKKAIVYFVAACATALAIAFGLQSCNVVRTVTTTAQTVSRGDTVTQISTKTIESYTAKKQ